MKQITVITILICSSLSLIANDTITFRNRLDLSLSSIKLEDGSVQLGGYGFSRLNYNRNINDFFSVGGYFGFSWYQEFMIERNDSSVIYSSTGEKYYTYYASYSSTGWKYAAQYGLNGKLHILPLILKKNISRFDFYMSGDVGLISMFTTTGDNIFPKRGTYFDYSLMGGALIFLSKSIGLFVEVGYRDFKYHQGSDARFGLSYRF